MCEHTNTVDDASGSPNERTSSCNDDEKKLGCLSACMLHEEVHHLHDVLKLCCVG
eukprot:m.946280 g.946280  ORF g.946280 m.946280 type:complete len:55 (+) comp23846_c0_seq15:86-250(+)